MDLNPINKPKRKRLINKAEWSKEKRKRLRIAGKEYVNAKGEMVSEKQPGPDCQCRRRCYEKIPKATRMKLFKGYYALKSHDEQNAYLFGLIRKVPIARKRAEGSTRRTCTFNYYIRVGGQETQVCVKALANIHGVGKSKIHILCEKLGQNVLFPRDERGRHSTMPKKVSDDTVEVAKQHILSILHSDRARDFLKDEKANNGPDVNITQMHKDFLDAYDPTYADELLTYEKTANVNRESDEFNSAETETFITTCEYRHLQTEYTDQNGEIIKCIQPIEVVVDANGKAHPVVSTATSTHNVLMPMQHKKKRKTTKEGKPEPLIRQWYYSKIFHEIYTTKEAIALRKKILSWKSNEDYLTVKPRKQRAPKKVQVQQQQQQQQLQQQQQQQHVQHETIQVHQHTINQDGHLELIQTRLGKGTNTVTLPITTQNLQIKKIVTDGQIHNFPLKKKPIQVFQAQGQDMYSIYPMILQDLSQLDTTHAVNLTHAQPIQQQIRVAPTHFQTVGQPQQTMAITAGNLQALGVNINIAAPNVTHYTTTNGILNYKFE